MKNKGIVYLSGGGNWDKTTAVDTDFLNSLDKKNILFIPVAKETEANGYNACHNWLLDKLSKIDSDIKIKVELDFNNIKDLSSFSAVYIGGGNTYKLLRLINESNFFKTLKTYINNGGVVFGASAGAVIFGKDIETYSEENEKYNYLKSEGLSLLNNYSVMCHYIDRENSKIEDYIKRTNNNVLALSIGAALKVSKDFAEVIGSGSSYLFKNDGTKVILGGKVSLSGFK